MRVAPIAAVVVAILCLGSHAPSFASAEPASIEGGHGDRDRFDAVLTSSELGSAQRESSELSPAARALPGAIRVSARSVWPWGRNAGRRLSRSIPLLPISERQGAPRAPPALLH